MANKQLQRRAEAMERYKLNAYHIQMMIELGYGFDSLPRRQEVAWAESGLAVPQYLEKRYCERFGRRRPETKAFVPPPSKRSQSKPADVTALHPLYEKKATALRVARETVGHSRLELARLSGIPPHVIEALEDPESRRAVPFETIIEIANTLGYELLVEIRLVRNKDSRCEDAGEGKKDEPKEA